MRPRKKSRPRHSQDYRSRNTILKAMGFRTYALYLKSALWRSIRLRVLASSPDCFTCGGPAVQVHHTAYDRPTLEGRSLRRLVSLCVPCHRLIEMDGVRKRTMKQAATKMAQMRAARMRFEAGGY